MVSKQVGTGFLLAVLVGLAGCTGGIGDGSSEDGAGSPSRGVGAGVKGTWAGRVKDTDAFVALIADGEQIAAYVCEDGEIAEWFFGPAGGPALVLKKGNGAELAVTFDGPAQGSVTLPDGSVHEFTAEETDDEVLFRADAGVQGVDDVSVLAGWIQIGDETRGSVAVRGSTTTLQAAPPLPPPTEVTEDADDPEIATDDLTEVEKGVDTTMQVFLLPPGLVRPTVPFPIAEAVAGRIEAIALLTPTPMTPDTIRNPTPNSTKFVWASLGESYAAGEGNPASPLRNDKHCCPPLGSCKAVTCTRNSDCPGVDTCRIDIDNYTGLSWGSDRSTFVAHKASDPSEPSVERNQFQDDITTCHRSDQAGAPKANRKLKELYGDMNFVLGHMGCAGANLEHMDTTPYEGPLGTPASRNGRPKVLQPVQFARVVSLKNREGQLDAIYMHIGGNDMGFGHYIVICALADILLDPLIFTVLSPLAFFDCSFFTTANSLSRTTNDTLNKFAAVKENLHKSTSEGGFGISRNVPVFLAQVPNIIHHGRNGFCNGADYDAEGETGFAEFDEFLKTKISVDEALFLFQLPDNINLTFQKAAEAGTPEWNLVDPYFGDSDTGHFGHGICDSPAFINLNSVAIRTQGPDLPTGPVRLSGGIFHPNNAGYEAQAEKIVDALRPEVDKKVKDGLRPPTNLRVSSVTGTQIILAWNDRATSENSYEIEVEPAGSGDRAVINAPPRGPTITRLPSGGFRKIFSNSKGQRFVHGATGRGLFKYRVRACNLAIVEDLDADSDKDSDDKCGEFSAPITGANFPPDLVIGLHATDVPCSNPVNPIPRLRSPTPPGALPDPPGSPTNPILGSVTRSVTVSWTGRPEAIQYDVIHLDPLPSNRSGDGLLGQPTIETSQRTFRTQTTGTSVCVNVNEGTDLTRFRVAACNRAGCSDFASTPTRPSTRP